MEEHKGQILERVVRRRHGNITELAELVGYDRQTIYRHFKDSDLSDVIILKYAKALQYDFRLEFPELMSYSSHVAEPLSEYTPLTVADAMKEIDRWKNKYIDLLEKHNDLLSRIKLLNQ